MLAIAEKEACVTACNLIVMKFGGTSLATPEAQRTARNRVRERIAEGKRVVVVVSAIGRAGDPYATDTLLSLVPQGNDALSREADALLACGEEISAAVFAAYLISEGVQAVSLQGFQTGILTDDRHGDAVIREIRPAKINSHLERDEVVVVAGFQGITAEGEVTTLGRGGSDTTAVVLAAALKAERAEIYTDVPGLLTADPRVVPQARCIAEMGYEESAELMRKGARVLHPRAAERAGSEGVAVVIRGADQECGGTWLGPEEGRWSSEGGAAGRVTAITSMSDISQLEVAGTDSGDEPAMLERVFGSTTARDISLDMMNIFPGHVTMTLLRSRAGEAAQILWSLGLAVTVRERCAKVTLVGGGIHGIPGIMHRIVRALGRRRIAILQSVDSHMMISVLVDARHELEAVRALHNEFFKAQQPG